MHANPLACKTIFSPNVFPFLLMSLWQLCILSLVDKFTQVYDMLSNGN